MNRLINPLNARLGNILIFGERLLALTEDGRRLFIRETSSDGTPGTSWITDQLLIAKAELVGTIEFDNGFTATHILHPATYLNKILGASHEGAMELWNIRTLYVHNSHTVAPC